MTASENSEVTPGRRRNPYRGPHNFGRGDKLPNRQREAQELADRVVSEGAVLLHSPSGAGKTSLVEAAVVNCLKEDGFLLTPRLRVTSPLSSEQACNPYIYSLVSYLLKDVESQEPASNLTLDRAIEKWQLQQPADMTTVLFIDQLEEILTHDPTDWGTQEEFFRELGRLMKTRPVWALLSMREDYMGGLDRYLRFLPGSLRSRYRLDFLTAAEAKLAMQVPAREQRVDFTNAAAEELADRLSAVEVQLPGGEQEIVKAPYVEPVQLQVVCRQLWKNIRKARGDDFLTIEVVDAKEHADIDQALTQYFSKTVESVVQATGANERVIRNWFESELINKQHIRVQTLKKPETTEPLEVLRDLEDGYLIRGDVRGSTTWYELAHDRLIGAVLASNELWRWNNLEPWQIAAHEWNAGDRNQALLLPAHELARAGSAKEITDIEQEFLKASANQEKQVRLPDRIRSFMGRLIVVAVAEAIVIAVLVIILIVR